MSYNRRIRELREDNDKTQAEIAKILNTEQSYYAKYESGKHPLPINHLITICNYYQVSADYILGLEKGLKWPREEKKLVGTNSTKYDILQSEKDPTKTIFLFSSGHPECSAPRMSFIVTDYFYRSLTENRYRDKIRITGAEAPVESSGADMNKSRQLRSYRYT